MACKKCEYYEMYIKLLRIQLKYVRDLAREVLAKHESVCAAAGERTVH